MAGMEAEKQVIERRTVLPLAEPNLAEQYGVSPPNAVVLFGPPGTGKTSFAKAVAGRLGWPFVELFPSRLAGPDVAMTTALREAFVNLMELETAVVHRRGGRDRGPGPSRRSRTRGDQRAAQAHPGVPSARRRLLTCATNSVRSLDLAFRGTAGSLHHSVGPPDEVALRDLAAYLGANADVVSGQPRRASEMFTPADIEFAARKGAQTAFEREVEFRRGEAARTDDYLAAIADTRPTLTDEMVAEFTEDIAERTRL